MNIFKKLIVSFFCSLQLLFTVVQCMKMTRFEVPSYAVRGQPQTLMCMFRLQPWERLVNLKWYFNDKEFLRYEPNLNRETQLFNLPNLRLNLQDVSNDEFHGSKVKLQNVDQSMEGSYTCEITCNEKFFTITEVKVMQVVDPPEVTTRLFPVDTSQQDLQEYARNLESFSHDNYHNSYFRITIRCWQIISAIFFMLFSLFFVRIIN